MYGVHYLMYLHDAWFTRPQVRSFATRTPRCARTETAYFKCALTQRPRARTVLQTLPATAEEYLRMVRRQAKKIPDVVVAPVHHRQSGSALESSKGSAAERGSDKNVGGYAGEVEEAAEELLPSVIIHVSCVLVCVCLVMENQSCASILSSFNLYNALQLEGIQRSWSRKT